MNEILCPGCGQSDVRKVSLLFEQGTVTNKMNPMVGVGMGGGHLGVGVAAGIGWKGQSVLASRLAPPDLDTTPAKILGFVVWALLIAVGIFAAFAGSPLGAILIFGSFLAGYLTYRLVLRGELPGYQADMARWSRQWCCMRCGQVFERTS